MYGRIALAIHKRDYVGLKHQLAGVSEHGDVIISRVFVRIAGRLAYVDALSDGEVEALEGVGAIVGGAEGIDFEEEGLKVEGSVGVVKEGVAGVDGHVTSEYVLGDVQLPVCSLRNADSLCAN